ncbi:hypothetical protein RJ640_023866 [Escallonia rubra]|uniref:GAG-pre-integrase domain-containing protein n=1 Tax=Escallonia rubra TaxID=112253 RepID=A0AA88SBH9_9ASTE|nr:hypothetical protein RJ640_023866 [Escallonia rubra]
MGLFYDYEDRCSSLLSRNPTPTLAATLVDVKFEDVQKKASAILTLSFSTQNILAILTTLAPSSRPSFKKMLDDNVYSIQINDLANQDVKCLSAISETSWLWHRRLGHMHMEHLKDISSKELVRGLPKIKFEKDKVCDACQMGKQKKVSHKPKKMVSTSRPLQLLHMDLFGPIPYY